MRPIILDLIGDPAWQTVAIAQGAKYVPLVGTDFWRATPNDAAVIVDSRNRYEEGLELISRLAVASVPGCARVLITERESAKEHERAYRAGTTRVVLMGLEESGHAAVLSEVAGVARRR